MEDNKKLVKETLRELIAAKERYTRDGNKCPVELDHRIKMYAGGLVKDPMDFDREIRHITTALIIEENDFKYDPALGKFVNGRDETASMKDAVRANDINDKKRKEDINIGKRDASQVVYQNEHENTDLEGKPINTGINGWPTTLISDKSKIYKGGSWADRAYWLSSGNKRFLDEDKSSALIGFRCAMDRVGSSRQSINEKKRK